MEHMCFLELCKALEPFYIAKETNLMVERKEAFVACPWEMWKTNIFWAASTIEDLHIGVQMHEQDVQVNQLAQPKIELKDYVEELLFDTCLVKRKRCGNWIRWKSNMQW
jgi:hypothetical protein